MERQALDLGPAGSDAADNALESLSQTRARRRLCAAILLGNGDHSLQRPAPGNELVGHREIPALFPMPGYRQGE